jgi:hypothetical protein
METMHLDVGGWNDIGEYSKMENVENQNRRTQLNISKSED